MNCTEARRSHYHHFAQLQQIHYYIEEVKVAFEENYAKLDPAQKLFVNQVISCIENNSSKIFFLDAVAGPGKTFCFRACDVKKIAIGVATIGMTSTIKNGCTAQSGLLHLPVTTEENCTWHVTAQSQDAQLVCKVKVIV